MSTNKLSYRSSYTICSARRVSHDCSHRSSSPATVAPLHDSSVPGSARPPVLPPRRGRAAPMPGPARPPPAAVLPPPLLCLSPLNLLQLQSCSAAPAVDNERTARPTFYTRARVSDTRARAALNGMAKGPCTIRVFLSYVPWNFLCTADPYTIRVFPMYCT